MHSDNGTNFVGASNLLTPLQEFFHSSTYQDRISSYLGAKQIRWYFNPPSSPHFGGLWEAGVKLTKSLILKSIGTQRLTGEELTTLLTQIKATLNSHPLCPLSNDPTDLEALTPSHFLTQIWTPSHYRSYRDGTWSPIFIVTFGLVGKTNTFPASKPVQNGSAVVNNCVLVTWSS